jgi:hypothetical protein
MVFKIFNGNLSAVLKDLQFHKSPVRALRDMAAQPEPAATDTEAELAAEREPAL